MITLRTPVRTQWCREWLHMLDSFGISSYTSGGDGAVTPDGPGPHPEADAELIRRTAAWLRGGGAGAVTVGLTGEKDVRAMTALLDMLAAELSSMDPTVRRATVEWCRIALGEVDPGTGRPPSPGRPG